MTFMHIPRDQAGWKGEGQKGVKVMIYSSPFTEVTHFPPQHPSHRVSAWKGAWSSRLLCFHSSGKEKIIQSQVRRQVPYLNSYTYFRPVSGAQGR